MVVTMLVCLYIGKWVGIKFDFEILGTWFWEKTKAGRLILCLEAVSLESDNKILKQIVDMSLITPRFWSEGPLPGTSGSGW